MSSEMENSVFRSKNVSQKHLEKKKKKKTHENITRHVS